jgi:hypothetical protein
MLLSRRNLIRSAASVAIAAPSLQLLSGCGAAEAPAARRVSALALAHDPSRLLDLAPGLRYTVISRTGDPMADGFPEPAAHDGMAAFPVEGDPGKCLLVRNHELVPGAEARGAFGADGAGGLRVAPNLIYGRRPGGNPHPGGTTTVLVDLKNLRAERTHLSLAGTVRNCAGGPTPWGSWLTCEETQLKPGAEAQKPHGFVFEVPAAGKGLADPVPLTGLGRYSHEACAVDPATGIVYLSEDTGDSLFYRFLPSARGELAKGGRLQALAIEGQSGADTRNWSASTWIAGQRHRVRWIDLDHVEAPDGDLRLRGRKAGAAIFARGEGVAFALEADGAALYLACTSGGAARKGQVWRYHPSLHEGTSREADAPGAIELFVESRSDSDFAAVDNIVASPRGDLVICEDGGGDNFVRAITPEGLIYPIARNADAGKSEFCGACFSPDGHVLFVNIQRPGITLAITGDWSALRTAARAAA